MGIDYGTKRVGVALSDERGEFALPHRVLPQSPKLVEIVALLAKDKEVTTIVVGESKDLAGEDNPLMKRINRFVEELRQASGVPVVLEPEFMTSAEAARLQGKTDMLDASAAALILKSYIDKKKNKTP